MKNRILWIIAAVSLIISAAAVNFMPDTVPMHYDLQGNADRYGSKYEVFIFSGVVIFFAAFWHGFIAFCSRMQKNAADEKTAAEAGVNAKVLKITAVAVLLMELAFQIVFIVKILNNADNTETMPLGLSSWICGIMGIVLAVVGNVMPKAKRNGIFGLRTSWSMANDKTWLASNRFGGAALFAGGIAITVCSLIAEGVTTLYIMIGVIIAVTLVSTVYSYMAYRKYSD
ncbi:MAG: SdpI family protein [Oscillospiraceae bacterium]|nr:SdpI family protein [Oscillospiraceae bacterium]